MRRFLLLLIAAGAVVLSGAFAAPANAAVGVDLVVAVPPDSGEDQPLPVGTGRSDTYFVELTNTGDTAAAAATLAIVLPASLELDPDLGVYRDDNWQDPDTDGGNPLTCTAVDPQHISCVVGPVATTTDALLEINVIALPSGATGTTADFTATVTPDAVPDANPADNSVTATVRFTGTAVLTAGLRATASTVIVGHTTQIVLTVKNAGPDPADEALGLALIGERTSTAHFRIVGFSGATFPGPVGIGAGGTGVFWNVGTIPAGGTATAVLTVKALRPGTSQIGLFTGSNSADPACDSDIDDPSCNEIAELPVTAKAAPAPKAAAKAALANTGSPVGGLAGAAGAALLAGIGLTWAGRRAPARG